eukprot:753154-Hanusia_phi.AAC.8
MSLDKSWIDGCAHSSMRVPSPVSLFSSATPSPPLPHLPWAGEFRIAMEARCSKLSGDVGISTAQTPVTRRTQCLLDVGNLPTCRLGGLASRSGSPPTSPTSHRLAEPPRPDALAGGDSGTAALLERRRRRVELRNAHREWNLADAVWHSLRRHRLTTL